MNMYTKMKVVNRVLALIMYIGAFVLSAFYIYVIIISKRYDVTDEYRLYYIEQELNDYLPDGTLEQYQPGRQYLYITEEDAGNRGISFGGVTEDGSWAYGESSKIYFNITSDRDIIFRIEYNKSGGIDNQLYVNGCYAGNIKVDGEAGYSVRDVVVAKDLIHEGINEFELVPVDDVEDSFENLYVYSVGIYYIE